MRVPGTRAATAQHADHDYLVTFFQILVTYRVTKLLYWGHSSHKLLLFGRERVAFIEADLDDMVKINAFVARSLTNVLISCGLATISRTSVNSPVSEEFSVFGHILPV